MSLEDPHSKDSYYTKSYSSVQRGGIQGWGNSLVDKLVEKISIQSEDDTVLEIGASSGEHFKFVKIAPSKGKYFALDLTPKMSDPELAQSLETSGAVTFIQGDASKLPFQDNYFNRVISMCVLAHVDDPEKVLHELRRVTRDGGNITIGMPTDPGMLNRLVKSLVTYPKLKKSGTPNPKLMYSREHKNGIGNLLIFIKEIFNSDFLFFRYFPLRIQSWNLNLAVVAHVKINKSAINLNNKDI